MATVTVQQAAKIVDDFEELLVRHGVSIPKHPQTGADMLPLWTVLKHIKENGLKSPSSEQWGLYTASLAAHDLAAKALSIKDSPYFGRLIEHFKLLANGAVHLTQEPPAEADAYNKLIELYWACLLIGCGVEPDLDPPKVGSVGLNPDIITLDQASKPMNGYAFKTIRSPHTESIRTHIIKGVDQIEVSAAPSGIVALNLTPRLGWDKMWPKDFAFANYMHAAGFVIDAMRRMLGEVVKDNGQHAVDQIFAGKKASGSVLCVAFAPTVAISPDTGNRTFMPIKIASSIALASNSILPHSLYLELWCANEVMQRRVFA